MTYLVRFLFTATLLASLALGQDKTNTFTIPNDAVGVIIRADNNQVSGTGFVIKARTGKPIVVTCFHVVESGNYLFRTVGSEKVYSLTLLESIPSQDTALLSPNPEIQTPGFTFGEGKHLSTGDYVSYIGYKVGTTSLMLDNVPITATGTGETIAGIADFLEFHGIAKPGFSGGPVLNAQGEVVAMTAEAWSQQGYQPKAQAITVNRAILTQAAKLLVRDVIGNYEQKASDQVAPQKP